VYFQVTSRFNKSITGRFIVPGNFEDGAKINRIGRSHVGNGGRGNVTLDLYTRSFNEYTRVAIPNKKIYDDYFADEKELKKIRERPRRQVAVTEATVADDQEALDSHARQVARIVEAYRSGVEIDAARPAPKGGAIHVRGSAQFLTAADGTKLFTKEVRIEREVVNEVLAMRVANAIGIDTNYAANPEPNIVIMKLVEGDLGASYNRRVGADGVMNLINDMENRPDVVRMAILDYLTRNGDRNYGNFIISPDGQVVPIDHGYVTWENPYVNSDFTTELLKRIRAGNSPISSAELLRMRNQIGALKREFGAYGFNTEWAAMMASINKLIDGVNGYVF
jgi:hypothetical protein